MKGQQQEEQLVPPPAYRPTVVSKDTAKDPHAKKEKPLGEGRLAVLRQQLMVFLGNSGVLGSGMVVSMPSVTLNQLHDETQPFWLNKDESSWFGKHTTDITHRIVDPSGPMRILELLSLFQRCPIRT